MNDNKSFRERLAEQMNNAADIMEAVVKLVIIAGLFYILYACTF